MSCSRELLKAYILWSALKVVVLAPSTLRIEAINLALASGLRVLPLRPEGFATTSSLSC